eukprot:COSAG01_NODE_9543_length_2414_cov_3.270842_2_plen_405_part_00
MKIFVLSFRTWLIEQGHAALAEAIDKNVYTPNRAMRMLESHKSDDASKTPFRAREECSDPRSSYFLQSDAPLQVLTIPTDKLPQLLRMADLSAPRAAPARARNGRAPGQHVDQGDVPTDVQDILRVQATEICPEARITEVRVRNLEYDGHQMYTAYCSRAGQAYQCLNPDCKETHVSNNFLVCFDRADSMISYKSFACNQWVPLKIHRSEPPTGTHYDLLGVPPSASGEAIIAAYRNKIREADDAAFQSLEAAYRLLSDTHSRLQYDARLSSGGGDDGDGDAQPGFREGPLTLGDIQAMNSLLFKYVTSPMYQQYLSGYEEDIDLDPKLVVGTGALVKEAILNDEGEVVSHKTVGEKVTIALRTCGTKYVCPFARRVHRSGQGHTQMTYVDTFSPCFYPRNRVR